MLGNKDSMAVKENKNSKKRKHDDSSDNDEYSENLKNEVTAKKFKVQDLKNLQNQKHFKNSN